MAIKKITITETITITGTGADAEEAEKKGAAPELPAWIPASVMALLITSVCGIACLQMWDKSDKNPYVLYALLSPIAIAVFALMLSPIRLPKRGAGPNPERRPVRAAAALLFALACAALCAFSAVTIDWNQAAGGNNWKLAGALWARLCL